jgi:hypothetical protein
VNEMGKFDAIPFKSLVNDPNSFKRPRQKLWGVFIISGYTESQGDLVTLNYISYNSNNNYHFGIEKDDGNGNKYTEYSSSFYRKNLIGYDENYVPPQDMLGPEGEEILSMKGNFLIKGAKELRTVNTYIGNYYRYNVPVFSDKDLLKDITLYYYYKIVKTISWDLVLLTSNLQEAKDLVNEWLRKPEYNATNRPRIGIDSVMLTEIIPSDSIIEV